MELLLEIRCFLLEQTGDVCSRKLLRRVFPKELLQMGYTSQIAI